MEISEFMARPSTAPAPAAPRRKNKVIDVARYADMLTAMGTESRLRVMRLLLSAHPTGLVVGDIAAELDISPSTLSYHLEKLKHESLIGVRRDGTFLWYSANTPALEELLSFLFDECCTKNKVLELRRIVCCP